MKNLVLLASISLMSIAPFTANAANKLSDTLVLKGSVAQEMIVEFTSVLVTGLNLSSTARQELGSIHYKSNSNSGFSISFASTNAVRPLAKMQRVGASDKISFTMSIDAGGGDAAKPLVSSKRDVPASSGIIESAAAEAVDVTRPISFKSDAEMDAKGANEPSYAHLLAGDYEGQVEATIAAK